MNGVELYPAPMTWDDGEVVNDAQWTEIVADITNAFRDCCPGERVTVYGGKP